MFMISLKKFLKIFYATSKLSFDAYVQCLFGVVISVIQPECIDFYQAPANQDNSGRCYAQHVCSWCC